MTDQFHDSPAVSSSPVSLSLEIPALRQLKVYEDEVLLDRAYRRLELNTRRRTPHAAVRAVSYAALVLSGAFLGIYLDRGLARDEAEQLAQHEIASEGVPAGLVTEAPVRASRDDSSRAPQTEEARERRKSRFTKNIPRLQRAMGPQKAPVLEADQKTEQPIEAVVTKPVWLVLADQGDYASAFQSLDVSGGFEPVLNGGSPEELMTLAEVARSVGQQGRAIQALQVVTERFQSDPNAPIAAMILGNLLDRAGDKAGAARAYALNRALSPGGDFAEDALVREFDMARAAGDVDRVEELRAQYEQEFPEGRALRDMRAEEARMLSLVGRAEQHMRAGEEVKDQADYDGAPESSPAGSGASGSSR